MDSKDNAVIDKAIRHIVRHEGPMKVRSLKKVRTIYPSIVLQLQYTTDTGTCRTVYVKQGSVQEIQHEYSALKYIYQKTEQLRFAQIARPLYFLPENNLLVTGHIEGETFYSLFFNHIYFLIFISYKNKLSKIAYNCGKAFQEVQQQFSVSYQPINFEHIMELIETNLKEMGWIRDEIGVNLLHTLRIVVEKNRDKKVAHVFPHGDLKPQNMLVMESGKIGILDWNYPPQIRLPVYSDLLSFTMALRLNPLFATLNFPVEIGNQFLIGYFQDNQRGINTELLGFFSVKSVTSLGVNMLKRYNTSFRKIILQIIRRVLKDEWKRLEQTL